MHGERGTLYWADRLLCQAHMPELEEREETAAKEAQASTAPLVSMGWRQPGSHTHRKGPGGHAALGTGPAAGLCTSSYPFLVKHHLLSTNCAAFGKAGASKEHFFLNRVGLVFFLLIASMSESVTTAQASPVSASSTCFLQQPWRIPWACFTLCSSAQQGKRHRRDSIQQLQHYVCNRATCTPCYHVWNPTSSAGQ